MRHPLRSLLCFSICAALLWEPGWAANRAERAEAPFPFTECALVGSLSHVRLSLLIDAKLHGQQPLRAVFTAIPRTVETADLQDAIRYVTIVAPLRESAQFVWLRVGMPMVAAGLISFMTLDFRELWEISPFLSRIVAVTFVWIIGNAFREFAAMAFMTAHPYVYKIRDGYLLMEEASMEDRAYLIRQALGYSMAFVDISTIGLGAALFGWGGLLGAAGILLVVVAMVAPYWSQSSHNRRLFETLASHPFTSVPRLNAPSDPAAAYALRPLLKRGA